MPTNPQLLAACALGLGLLTSPAPTAQAPTLLADINPGTADSTRTDQGIWRHPTAGFGIVQLNDGASGFELWRTDGTAAGTQQLFDLRPGPASGQLSNFMAAVGEEFWFSDLTDQSLGIPPKIWRTDGTVGAPDLVLDGAQAGFAEISFNGASVDGDGLAFVRAASSGPWELWRIDRQGRHQVVWNLAAAPHATAWPFFLDGNHEAVVFQDALGDIYFTDGTTAGTSYVAPNTALAFGRALGGFVVRERITLPGPVVGTRLHILRPGAATLQLTWPTEFVVSYGFDDLLWVLVDDRDLLVFDDSGTATQVATFVPSSDLRRPQNLFGVVDDGTTKLFFADGGNGAGRELWSSDGTAAGTRMVVDLEPGPTSFPVDSIHKVRDRMVFWGPTPNNGGSEPWSSDGTAAGTIPLGDLEPGPGSSSAAYMFWPNASSALLAIRTSAHGLEPWFCDGTPQGTRLAADIWPGPSSSIVVDPFSALFFGSVVGDRGLFPANDGTHGVEYWTLPLPSYQMAHATLECGRRADLELFGWPALGGSVELRMRRLAPTTTGIVAASVPAAAALATVEGCGIYLDAATALTAALVRPDASGSWSQQIPVPNQPSLVGSQLVFQAATLDATSPTGWRPSTPWRVTLGR